MNNIFLSLAVSDASGDSAIFEYIGGELVIHHDRSCRVMTNPPVFSEQPALNKYWRDIGGTVMLPGTNRASDRFVRASFYIDAIPRLRCEDCSCRRLQRHQERFRDLRHIFRGGAEHCLYGMEVPGRPGEPCLLF